MQQDFDFVIIGAGAAGLTAAQYGARANLKTAVIESGTKGGQALLINELENYPGIFPAVNGFEFAQTMQNQAQTFGAQFFSGKVQSVDKCKGLFVIKTEKDQFTAKALLLATGAKHRSLDIPGEAELAGRGVSYCATCDGFFYKGKTIGVVAQGTESIEEIKYLAEIAQKVLLVADFAPDQHGFSLPQNVHLIEEKIEKIEGSLKAQKMVCTSSAFEFDGVFILRQNVDLQVLVPGLACSDGFITVDKNMQTNIAGCFACGDCTGKPFQYAKAAGEGNIAAHSACTYLDAQKQALQQAKN